MHRLRFGVLAAMIAVAALALPASSLGVAQIHDHTDSLVDYDIRANELAPTAAQLTAAKSLGATSVSWNRFGTPQSIVNHGGYLSTNIQAANAPEAARAFLRDNRGLFRLEGLDGLELYRDSLLAGNVGHAVTLRQTFGGVPAGPDGLVTVGLKGSAAKGWDVAYVSSSLTGDSALEGSTQISAEAAWVSAAKNARIDVGAADVYPIKDNPGWQTFTADGIAGTQQVRRAAFPTVKSGVVPAYEALVLDAENMIGYRTFVDARDGSVLARYNVKHSFDGESLPPVSSAVETHAFSGEVGPTDGACDTDKGPYTVGPGVRALDGFAAATVPLNDLVLELIKDGVVVVHADTLFSPEQFHYEPAGGVPPGNYFVRVCDFNNAGTPADPDEPWASPRTYTGTLTIDDTPAPPPYLARWKVFPKAPPLPPLQADPWNHPSTDTRETWCWVQAAGCDYVVGNLASRVPWDYNAKTRTPTLTTMGNNAKTATSWTHDLLPSPPQYMPTSATRDYSFEWSNDWNESDCDRLLTPEAEDLEDTTATPGAAWDDAAAVTNLFVAHNRMHDWAYNLGFTERNWNAQDYNFGLTDIAFENDPIIGDAQSGALTLTRDNANMITFPDGVASITNMYFWQPIAGFYAPCVDGDYGMAVIGHEYGHMIENRMEGKGANRTGFHAGAMGESGGDLFGMEYLESNGFGPVADEDPKAGGVYDTGNKQRGIRNYSMGWPSFGAVPEPSTQLTVNALNFSDMGYDVTETQVHADGEIWSATQHEIRETLIQKYNAQYPYSDLSLRRECNDTGMPASRCPGNRRWIQLYFDMMLLAPPNLSMLDGRDAMLAADVIRFGGANQAELWGVYGKRGFGPLAFSTNQCANPVPTGNPCASGGHTTEGIDTNPTPDFGSPLHTNAQVTFNVFSREGGAAVPARIYVGHYERLVSPVADTDPATSVPADDATRGWRGSNLDNVAPMVPGTYEFVVHAAGHGHFRFRQAVAAGDQVLNITLPVNVASKAAGAAALVAASDGDGADAAAKQATIERAMDDTEQTNWQVSGAAAYNAEEERIDVDGLRFTVDLAGTTPQPVNRIQVSAMLQFGQNRFTALRQFSIQKCNDAGPGDCTTDAEYETVYTSPADAFPGNPPRPVAPHLILREFALPDARAATHMRLVVISTQCTGGPGFQGDQDNDVVNNADCDEGDGSGPTANPLRAAVRVAEFQAFTASGSVTGPAAQPQPQPQPQPQTRPQPQPQPQPQPRPRARRQAAARCVVPNVRGRTVRRARAAVRRNRCRIGVVSRRNAAARRGLVIGQRPRPGTRLRVNGRVNLVLSAGRAVRPPFTG